MKLLFDANLSRKLVQRLADVFADSAHVAEVGLERADDRAVLDYAIEHDYVVVSKDEDFHQMVFLTGPPPKVVWVRLGNCTTAQVELALRDGRERISAFDQDPDAAFLILGRRTA